jgi:hypothetical protein
MNLLGPITRCPSVRECLANPTTALGEQVPEPRSGHLEKARLSFLGSNPSISESGEYPPTLRRRNDTPIKIAGCAAKRCGRIVHSREMLTEMTRVQAQDGVLRGIGFVLWSPDPGAASNSLSEQAFGHTGSTGTSLWIDLTRDLVIAGLTNRVYYGCDNADAIM